MTAIAQNMKLRLVSHAFAYDTPNLDSGVQVYVPTPGEWLFDAWFDITTGFDGTTPKADFGNFDNSFPSTGGVLASYSRPCDLSGAGSRLPNNQGLWSLSANDNHQDVVSLGSVILDYFHSSSPIDALVPLRFYDATPVKIVVSQTGKPSGGAIGGSTGAATFYLQIGRT